MSSAPAPRPSGHPRALELVADAVERSHLAGEFERLITTALNERVLADAERYGVLLRDFCVVEARLLRALGDAGPEMLESVLKEDFDKLVAKELGDVDVMFKLAARHLQQAVEVLIKVNELMRVLLHGIRIPGEMIDKVIAGAPDGAAEPDDDGSIVILHLSFDVVVALSQIQGDAQAFVDWSARAVQASRQADAWLLANAPSLKARRARLKARTSWNEWDEEEIEHEASAWRRHLRE